MLTLYSPTIEELWFRKRLLADKETMAFNHAYGGTIEFPVEKWETWYVKWFNDPKRFYRYLYDEDNKCFVGEVAYHYDEKRLQSIASIIILDKYRNRGYGSFGLKLLCEAAKNNGLTEIFDDIAYDNHSISLFLNQGFEIVTRDNKITLVKKELNKY